MKTIILAGGLGTRLGQQAETIPKPMVLIGGKPILWHIMKIYSHYGFSDFIICLGTKASVIKSYFFEYEIINNDFTIDISSGKIEYHNRHDENNWKITLVDTGQDTLKGGRIKKVAKYLEADTNMLTYGDGLTDVNLKKLLEFHKSHDKLITITGVHRPARFGELVEKGGQVRSFTEKPQFSKELINGGFMVFNRGMLDYLKEDDDCDFEIGPLENLARAGQVMVYKHEGSWDCMDHERDVAYLNQLWRENKAFWKVWK
jgi:glucose-1-phosphate cytidylyltransferase